MYSAMVVAIWLTAVAVAITDGSLQSLSQTDNQVDAKYMDTIVGLGITISSSEQNVLISSLNGEVLVNLKQPFYQEGDDLDQIVVIQGKPFLDHRREDEASSYSITTEEAEELIVAAKMSWKFTANIIDSIIKAEEKNEKFHQEALHSAITYLVNDPHTPIIINMAITMGEEKGMTGTRYPPVLPFYSVARLLGKLLDNQKSVKNDNQINPIETCETNFPCFYSCPPCRDDNCIGLCGRRCNCWEFVCGTCCWQRGCCIHDACCRKNGLFTLACLNVLSLTCTSFNCPR